MSKSILVVAMACLSLTVGAFAQSDSANNDSAQEPPPPPCSQPEFRQFDFWVGEWDLTWGDSGRGTNIITIELDSCVIEENFSTIGEPTFRGHSVSTYNPNTKQWQQTWVDNQGTYLDFTGEFKGGNMILSRTVILTDGGSFTHRMVWFNIEQDSLDWNWERSTDGGQTWTTLWAIHYERKK